MKRSFYYLSVFTILLILVSCFRNPPSAQKQENPDSNQIETSDKSNNFNIHSLDDLYDFLTYREDRYPLVSAHRGGDTDGYP